MSRPDHATLRHAVVGVVCVIASALPLLLLATPGIAQTATQPSSASQAESFDKPASAAKRLRMADPPYPAAIQDSIDASRRYCLAEGGTSFVAGPGLVRTGDLDGDGRGDYIVDLREARCTERPAVFSGTAGWDVDIFVTHSKMKLVRVFAGNVLDYDIDDRHRGSMMFRLHGGLCGKFGPDLCLKRRRLDGRPFESRNR